MFQIIDSKIKKWRSSGFTLIELVVVMAIVAILATVAIPGFYVMQQNMRVSSAANKFHGLIQHARSAASKTQSDIHLCPVDGRWDIGAYTTSGDCTSAPSSDRERRTIRFDSQVTVSANWSTDGLVFTAGGALTSATGLTPVTITGTSDASRTRNLVVTTTGTSKVETPGGS